MWEVTPIRIAVSGTFSVGKSTFCHSLAEDIMEIYPNRSVALIGNVSRDLTSSGKVTNDKGSAPHDYYLYVNEYVKRLLHAKADILIHDRTLLDTLAYVRVNGNAHSRFVEMLETLVYWYVSGVSHYFYIPPEIPIVYDNIRLGDEAYRTSVDIELRKSLDKIWPQYAELRGTVQERKTTALEILGFARL